VSKKAIIDLGYPFEEDNNPKSPKIVITKALSTELIDEVLSLSKEYMETEREPLPSPAVPIRDRITDAVRREFRHHADTHHKSLERQLSRMGWASAT